MDPIEKQALKVAAQLVVDTYKVGVLTVDTALTQGWPREEMLEVLGAIGLFGEARPLNDSRLSRLGSTPARKGHRNRKGAA